MLCRVAWRRRGGVFGDRCCRLVLRLHSSRSLFLDILPALPCSAHKDDIPVRLDLDSLGHVCNGSDAGIRSECIWKKTPFTRSKSICGGRIDAEDEKGVDVFVVNEKFEPR